MKENMKILQFIATGLVLWQKQYEKEKTYFPIPDILARGINMLAARSIEAGDTYPKNTKEIVENLSRPISQWMKNVDSLYFQDPDRFIDQGQLTDLCYEFYIDSKIIEDEIQQKLMLQVINICSLENDQQGYVNFRRKVIKDRILKINEVIEWSNDLNNSSAAIYFKDCYEKIPAYAIKERDVYQCNYCGWTVEWDNDLNPKCITPLCHYFTNSFRKITKIKEKAENILRLNRGCMRFIAKPGMYELELEKKLQAMGLEVEMWPEFDKYDLKVTFPNGLAWAVDVKDYSSPLSLEKNIKTSLKDVSCDEFFYVIPQYRYRFNKSFEKVFSATYQGSDKVQLLMEKNFIAKVKLQLGGKE